MSETDNLKRDPEQQARLRRINRLIAETFFNWQVFADRAAWEAAGSPRGRLIALSENVLPQYSSHLPTAWTLIPLLCLPQSGGNSNGKWMTFSLDLDESLWTAEFALKQEYDVPPEHQAVLGKRDTRTLETHIAQSEGNAALAICRAALKVRGVSVQGFG